MLDTKGDEDRTRSSYYCHEGLNDVRPQWQNYRDSCPQEAVVHMTGSRCMMTGSQLHDAVRRMKVAA